MSEEKDKVIILHENSNLFGEEICKEWANHLNKTSGYEGLCVTNDQFNSGHNSVYAYKGGLPAEEPGKSDQPKKGGLGLPIIIGITVASVVVVAVVVIVVIFVVRKKKKSYDSLTGEILNNNMFLPRILIVCIPCKSFMTSLGEPPWVSFQYCDETTGILLI